MKIYAPNKYANGVYASVQFIDGVGETDNPKLIEWFESKGYEIERQKSDQFNLVIEPQNDEVEIENDEVEPDFDSMNALDLRDWMRENGYGSKIKNTRDKEKLLKILRG